MTTIIEHPEYGRVEGNRECWDIDGSEYYEKDGCRRYRDDGWMVVRTVTHHRTKITEQLAAIWREIGQPNVTDDLRLIIPWGGELCDFILESGDELLLGMPVLVGTPQGVTEIGLAGKDADLVIEFDKAARQYDWSAP